MDSEKIMIDISNSIFMNKNINSERYSTLLSIAAQLARGHKFFNNKNRDEIDCEAIIHDSVSVFVYHIMKSDKIPLNPISYLRTILYHAINKKDKTLANKEFLYFREIFNSEVKKLENIKKIVSNEVGSVYLPENHGKGEAETSEIELIAHNFDFNELLGFSTWTSSVRIELSEFIYYIISNSNKRIAGGILLRVVAERLGLKPGQLERIDDYLEQDDDEFNDKIELVDPELTPDTKYLITEILSIIEKRITAIFSTPESKLSLEMFWKHVFRDKTFDNLKQEYEIPLSTIHHKVGRVKMRIAEIVNEGFSESSITIDSKLMGFVFMELGEIIGKIISKNE